MEGKHAAGNDVLWQAEMLGRFRLRRQNPATPDATAPFLFHFQTRQTGLLLAVLALNPGVPLYREDLIFPLWPDADNVTGRDRLSQALSWLRRHLETGAGLAAGTVLQADRQTIQLASGAIATDVASFEAAMSAVRAALSEEEATEWREKAAGLYQGPLLPGFTDEAEWLFLERQRLASLFQENLRQLAASCLRAGRAVDAAAYCRRRIAEDPEDEEAYGDLLRCLEAAGEPASALRTYTAFVDRRKAAEEAPSLSLQALAEDIRTRMALRTLASAAHAPIALTQAEGSPESAAVSPRATPTVLPLTLTRFFGREEDLRLLLARLIDLRERMITLLGPGGSGKTRLAIELGQRFAKLASIAGEPERAVFFVSLEHVTAGRYVLRAVCDILRRWNGQTANETVPPGEVIARILASIAHPLLLLDNCEHLAEDEDFRLGIHDLLQGTPALAIIVTSRRHLGIEGELRLALPPLAAPSDVSLPPSGPDSSDPLLDIPSVQLFLDRARYVDYSFRLTPENRETLAALCSRLEGIPLAIELCAAWAATLTPEQMLHDLCSRFSLLVSRRRDLPERHRTMRAAVESSYLHLSEELQAFFIALSVFRSGWNAEAAEAVIGQNAEGETALRDNLAQLQERSLILTDASPETSGARSSGMRYRMLETLREFAWDQLTEVERQSVSERHAVYYLQFAETAASSQAGPERRRLLDTLEREQDNLRAALDYLIGLASNPRLTAERQRTAVEQGLRLSLSLEGFWNIRGHLREGRERLEWFFQRFHRYKMGASPNRIEASGLSAIGRVAWAQGDFQAARTAHETALIHWRHLEEATGIARALLDLGMTVYRQGQMIEAQNFLSESLEIAQAQQDTSVMAGALLNLGNISRDSQELNRARTFFEESLKVARQHGDERRVASALNNLGNVARTQKDFDAATRFHAETLSIRRRLGDRHGTAMSLLNLAELSRQMGKKAEAVPQIRESLLLLRDLGDRFSLAEALLVAAGVASACGQHESVAALLGAAAALRQTAAVALAPADEASQRQFFEAAQSQLGADRFLFAYRRGGDVPPAVMIDEFAHREFSLS